MISQSDLDLTEFPGYKLMFAMMLFTPIFLILFYVLHPFFSIFYFLSYLNDDQYQSLSTGYTIFMSVLFCLVNSYFYY